MTFFVLLNPCKFMIRKKLKLNCKLVVPKIVNFIKIFFLLALQICQKERIKYFSKHMFVGY